MGCWMRAANKIDVLRTMAGDDVYPPNLGNMNKDNWRFRVEVKEEE